MKYFLFVFLFFISSLSALESNKVILNGDEQHIKLTPHISYYLDRDAKLNEHTISSKIIEFKNSTKDQISFGHNHDAYLWITFTLENNSYKNQEYILEYVGNIVYRLDLYDERGSYINSSGAYDLELFQKNIGHTLKVQVPAKSSMTYYIKIQNPISSMMLDLSLWDSSSYVSYKNSYWNIVSFLHGAMFILILYNLMLFFFTRDKSYFYYVLVTSAMLYHELNTTGFILFFPDLMIPYTVNAIHVLVLISFVFIPVFARSFLQLQTLMPRVDTYLKYAPVVLIAVTVLSIYSAIPTILNRLVFVTISISVIVIAFIALYKGVKQARYYVIGWSGVLAAFGGMMLYRAGYFPFNLETFHLPQASIVFEALIFSVGLAARIRYMKEEKEASDSKLILHQKEEKVRLEKKVSQRTKELNKALNIKNLLIKEVHHRVKNNIQIIISLIRLQADVFEDKRIKEAMLVSEQRIKAMGSVHEMLYAHDDISEIDSKEYFESLVDEARFAYDIFENITVTIETEEFLGIDYAIYVGLIINELVTNSYKYAFDSKEGKINISLIYHDGEYTLEINDNGKGGEIIDSDNSLGMMLVDTLVTQQLKGSIETFNDNGMKHILKFKKEVE